jgi:hypothetical protein
MIGQNMRVVQGDGLKPCSILSMILPVTSSLPHQQPALLGLPLCSDAMGIPVVCSQTHHWLTTAHAISFDDFAEFCENTADHKQAVCLHPEACC